MVDYSCIYILQPMIYQNLIAPVVPKQFPLNSTAIFELWIYFSFGARLLSGAEGGLMLSTDNPLDHHVMIVSVSLVSIKKV